MQDKKSGKVQDELAAIEQRVDAMMDTSKPDPEVANTPVSGGTQPAIDIFAGRQTAPELPGATAAGAKSSNKDKSEAANETVSVNTDSEPAAADGTEPGAIDDTKDSSMATTETPVADIGNGDSNKPSDTAAVESKEPTKPSIGADNPADAKLPLDDAKTDAMVDDIVAHEGDIVLAAQDAAVAHAVGTPRKSFGGRIKGFFAAWWHNKPARYATLLVVFLALGSAAAIPTSRYYVLNNAGVRSAASLTIIDNATKVPLKNISVTMGGQSAKTNADGEAKLTNLTLGTHQLTIDQPGFAPVSQELTLGWGSNPLGDYRLRPVGIQYRFKLSDFVSGKPVTQAEITYDDSTAQSNDKGEVVLTLGALPEEVMNVNVSANGYRTERLKLDSLQKDQVPVVMVTDRKLVYISKQSGKYDLYRMDIDGRNKQILLAGTGTEDEQISLVVHPDGKDVAMVSRRTTDQNQDGFRLQSLTVVNIAKGTLLRLDQSEQIRLVDWIDNRLVYVKVRAGTSAGNAERYQLVSYDYKAAARVQLASANYFNDVVSARGGIYYAASNPYEGDGALFGRVNPDGTNKQSILKGETIWSVHRSRYNILNLSTPNGWYEYKLGDNAARKLSGDPANVSEARFYLDDKDRKRALWTDLRDGKGVLLSYSADSQKDKTLASQSGLGYPLRWLDERTVIYRVANQQETAEYVVGLDGGAPKKIVDVTNTSGMGRWLYR